MYEHELSLILSSLTQYTSNPLPSDPVNMRYNKLMKNNQFYSNSIEDTGNFRLLVLVNIIGIQITRLKYSEIQ